VVFVQSYDLAPKWALISLVSFELACGGLDNLLAHHRAQQGALAWGLRMGVNCGLLAWSLTASSRNAAWWTSVGALALSTIAIGILFWQKRSYYLDTIPKVPKGAPAQVVA
jgi:hypothetical protein